jgi:hypothetical protein
VWYLITTTDLSLARLEGGVEWKVVLTPTLRRWSTQWQTARQLRGVVVADVAEVQWAVERTMADLLDRTQALNLH